MDLNALFIALAAVFVGLVGISDARAGWGMVLMWGLAYLAAQLGRWWTAAPTP